MPFKTSVLGLATALAVAATALAAPTAGAPLTLVLKRSDFPAGTRASSRPMPAYAVGALGRGLKGASFSASVPAGGGSTETAWLLTGDVIVAPDRAAARRLFQLGKSARIGLFSDVTGNPISLTLPAYGAEQLAFWTRSTSGRGVNVYVFVRKGVVVWQMNAAAIERSASKAQVVAELRKYAVKQKRRVGNG